MTDPTSDNIIEITIGRLGADASTRIQEILTRLTFEKASPKTWFDWYRVGLWAIKNYKPLADSKLDERLKARSWPTLQRIDKSRDRE